MMWIARSETLNSTMEAVCLTSLFYSSDTLCEPVSSGQNTNFNCEVRTKSDSMPGGCSTTLANKGGGSFHLAALLFRHIISPRCSTLQTHYSNPSYLGRTRISTTTSGQGPTRCVSLLQTTRKQHTDRRREQNLVVKGYGCDCANDVDNDVDCKTSTTTATWTSLMMLIVVVV